MIDATRLTTALRDRYVIERRLGVGGMATVYLARDPKHDRQVALKVLKPELAAIVGAERFLHEIRITAKLQHPQILPLHDSGEADGFLFYVMPYVEGETLRDRLNREKQLPIDEAIEIARHVASALDYAHRHGVIHRDIKPENILLHDRQALVADFGIALAVRQAGASRLTETGLSLGTPHYMSPEQAMGERELDARSDIYSLGAVLYEMLAGDPPYSGSTAQAIVAQVITEKPPLITAARETVPQHVARAIHKALGKLPADRYPTAAAFGEALVRPALVDTDTFPVPTPAVVVRRPNAWLVAGVSVALVVGLIAGWLLRRPPVERVIRLGVSLPGLMRAPFGNSAILSPDGSAIAYRAAGPTGEPVLFYRRLSQEAAVRLAGTEGAMEPTFSPDGQSIAFSIGPLMKISVSGGPPVLVTDSAGPSAAWGDDGRLYFTHPRTVGIASVPASGGPTQFHTVLDTATGEVAHGWPVKIPGRPAVIFSTFHGGVENADIAVLDLRTGQHSLLVRGVFGRYAASGHLVYAAWGGSLFVAPFDAGRLRVTGPPTPLLTNVIMGPYGSAELSISNDGKLLYQQATGLRGLAIVDRNGTRRMLPGRTVDASAPRISPDGRQVVYQVPRGLAFDIWSLDLSDSTPTRLTTDGDNSYPVWSADGRSILYAVGQGRDGRDFYRMRLDGGTRELLFAREGSQEEILELPQGRGFIYREGDLGLGRTTALRYRSSDTTDRVIVDGPFLQRSPVLSPDGRWLAYTSDQSGRSEVYVTPFPRPGVSRQVSTGGGTEPAWNPRGGELFYRSTGRLVALDVQTSPTFAIRGRRPLFPTGLFFENPNHTAYDVMPDGQHFVFVANGAEHQDVVLVLNWFRELRSRSTEN